MWEPQGSAGHDPSDGLWRAEASRVASRRANRSSEAILHNEDQETTGVLPSSRVAEAEVLAMCDRRLDKRAIAGWPIRTRR